MCVNGEVCDMQAHMADPTIHFHHCAEDGYAKDYKLEDHIKLCLNKEEIDWLWTHGPNGEETEHGHCKTQEGGPHLGPEGLLVCDMASCPGGSLSGCVALCARATGCDSTTVSATTVSARRRAL